MIEAVRVLGETGRSSEPLLRNILIAGKVNRLLGGAIITPWDVDLLPDTEIDALLAVADVPTYREHYQKIETIKEKWRRSHPHYQTRH